MAASIDIPVHDITPLLEIREYSAVWFLLLVVCAVTATVVVVKKIRTGENRIDVNARRERYETLRNIDVSDSKSAAYAICELAAYFAHDSEALSEAYRMLFEYLERYKYAPRVESMDEKSLELYRAYLQMIDV